MDVPQFASPRAPKRRREDIEDDMDVQQFASPRALIQPLEYTEDMESLESGPLVTQLETFENSNYASNLDELMAWLGPRFALYDPKEYDGDIETPIETGPESGQPFLSSAGQFRPSDPQVESTKLFKRQIFAIAGTLGEQCRRKDLVDTVCIRNRF